MSANFFFLNDYGVPVDLQVLDQNCAAKDISGSSAREFEFHKPDGTIVTKTAVFRTDGTDGWLRYLLEAGVLDTVGTWSVRAKVTISGGAYRTEKVQFAVKA